MTSTNTTDRGPHYPWADGCDCGCRDGDNLAPEGSDLAAAAAADQDADARVELAIKVRKLARAAFLSAQDAYDNASYEQAAAAACHAMTQDAHGFQHLCTGPAAHAGPHRNTHGYWPSTDYHAPEGSDLAAAAAAEQDADARVDLATAALDAARETFRQAQIVYDRASQEQYDAIDAATDARRAHVAAMRAAGVAQTADGYVAR